MIVVDWGTTNLRVFGCEADGTILSCVENAQGITSVPQGAFADVLKQALNALDGTLDSPLFVCGMAGARGGWLEAPYCNTPLSLKDIAAQLTPLPEGFDGYLLPGVKTVSPDGTCDVMRGEEIQIIGGMEEYAIRDGVLCLPGTHSKWVRIRDGRIVGFSTFMTGEVFQALSHTILACDPGAADDPEAFTLGLEMSVHGDCGLLHHLFTARTRMLDGTLTADQVSAYVSGLLIGHELVEAAAFFNADADKRIVLIGATALCERYRDALEHSGIDSILLESRIATCKGVAALNRMLQGDC